MSGRKKGGKSAKSNVFAWIIAIVILIMGGSSSIPGSPVRLPSAISDIFSGKDGHSDRENRREKSRPAKKTPAKKTPAPSPSGKSPAAASVASVPKFSGEPYAVINGNVPSFSKSDMTTKSYEDYSPLDGLGRCGVAEANIGRDLMPTEKRESISSVKPSGWKSERYDFVDGGYLYNRCHLIGFQLAGENANDRNLITGTRYLNVDGMLPFENMVADYVKETGNHVLYRVTPVYKGDNLVAEGVLMEAKSVEDDGESVCFNVFCYNNQPGVTIDYATGESEVSADSAREIEQASGCKSVVSASKSSNRSKRAKFRSKKRHRSASKGRHGGDY